MAIPAQEECQVRKRDWEGLPGRGEIKRATVAFKSGYSSHKGLGPGQRGKLAEEGRGP